MWLAPALPEARIENFLHMEEAPVLAGVAGWLNCSKSAKVNWQDAVTAGGGGGGDEPATVHWIIATHPDAMRRNQRAKLGGDLAKDIQPQS